MYLKRKKGYTLVLLCILLPVIISVIGLCIDIGSVVYYKSRLTGAVKFTAISASSNNYIENGNLVIVKDDEFVKKTLYKNFSEAELIQFSINESKKNECTVIAQTEVKIFFVKIVGIENKTITESYTVERN